LKFFTVDFRAVYALDTNLLLDIWFVNILSQYISYLFILLTGVFCKAKVNFDEVQFSNFGFWILFLVFEAPKLKISGPSLILQLLGSCLSPPFKLPSLTSRCLWNLSPPFCSTISTLVTSFITQLTAPYGCSCFWRSPLTTAGCGHTPLPLQTTSAASACLRTKSNSLA
jgi:hypothetical protein